MEAESGCDRYFFFHSVISGSQRNRFIITGLQVLFSHDHLSGEPCVEFMVSQICFFKISAAVGEDS